MWCDGEVFNYYAIKKAATDGKALDHLTDLLT